MSKRNIILIVLTLAILGMLASVFLFRPSVDKIDIDRGRPAEPAGPVPQIFTRNFPFEENSRYTIQVDYPELQGVSAPGVQEKVNGAIRAQVYNQIAAFQSANASNLPLGDIELRSSFDGSFDVSLLTRSFLSALMTYSDYSAGAAHPTSYSVAMNYDLKTGKEVTMVELMQDLEPSNGYMDRLGEYLTKDLVRQFGGVEDSKGGIVPDGTFSNSADYGNFTVSKDGFTVHFDPYEVAPYAAGLPKVDIPYGDLMSVIVKSGNPNIAASSTAKWWLE